MESIGAKLKAAREDRGLSVDQVARDTNISRMYIVALEEENYEAFPAEPYIMGFLRTYSDHLNLPTEEILSQYKNFKIQEQPAPMNALLEKRNPIPPKVIMITLGVLALGGLGVVFAPAVADLVTTLSKPKAPTVFEGKELVFPADKASHEERLYLGQTLMVPMDKESYKIVVKAIGDSLVLATPEGESTLKLSDEMFLDLDKDKTLDLRISLQDITPADPNKGILLAMERVTMPKNLGNSGLPQGDQVQPLAAIAGETLDPNRAQKPITIVEAGEAKPFTLDVVFRGDAFFRYLVDDKIRFDTYFRKGETVRVDATKKVALWVSNAGSFTGKIQGQDVVLGKPGEVASKVIEWVTENGKLTLRANPMY